MFFGVTSVTEAHENPKGVDLLGVSRVSRASAVKKRRMSVQSDLCAPLPFCIEGMPHTQNCGGVPSQLSAHHARRHFQVLVRFDNTIKTRHRETTSSIPPTLFALGFFFASPPSPEGFSPFSIFFALIVVRFCNFR